MLKLVYSFFLGMLLAVFVGMGVATFYASPKAPDYPQKLELRVDPSKEYTAEEKKLEQKYQADQKAYDKRSQSYSRNVSMIVLGAAVVLMVLGLVLESRMNVIADGLLLGGTLTLLYSIGRSFAGEDPKYSFVVTAIGLLVTLFVGYRKFMTAPSIGKSKK